MEWVTWKESEFAVRKSLAESGKVEEDSSDRGREWEEEYYKSVKINFLL